MNHRSLYLIQDQRSASALIFNNRKRPRQAVITDPSCNGPGPSGAANFPGTKACMVAQAENKCEKKS